MVLRSELLAAQSEGKAYKDDAAAKAQSLIWLEEQLGKAQQQLSDSRQEVAQLRVEMGGMVQRRNLDTMQLQLQEIDNALISESTKQREVIQNLNSRLCAYDAEIAEHSNKMQVCTHIHYSVAYLEENTHRIVHFR
jgi:chromosome segregation ATPase